MKIPIDIAELEEASKNRPKGYYDYVVSQGEIKGDILFVEEDKYNVLCLKYRKTATKSKNVRRMIRPQRGVKLSYDEVVNNINNLPNTGSDAVKWIKGVLAQNQMMVEKAEGPCRVRYHRNQLVRRWEEFEKQVANESA